MTEHQAGLAFQLITFGLIFVIGGLLWIVLDPVFMDIMSAAETHTSTTEAATGQTYLRQGWNAVPWIITIIGMVQLLVGAAAESDGRGGI